MAACAEPVDGADAELIEVIRSGDLDRLRAILAQRPRLARARILRGRTPLHVAADWPGYFRNAPETVRLLIAAGADPDATTGDPPSETPLHWAASSDDLEVAEALIDGGADLEARGGSINGGSPLANAVGYGCWHVARLLVGRGARIGTLWEAAALGELALVRELTSADPQPTAAELDVAFWQACHGGQRRTAEYLLELGADPHAVPDYSAMTAPEIASSPGTRRDTLAEWLRERAGAADVTPEPPGGPTGTN
jgi:hypothetical protein